LNLITHVAVDVAGAADCDYFQSAVEETQEVVTGKIETANTDGAYHSVENQDYCRERGIDFILGAIQGERSRYDLSLDNESQLVVTDLTTNTIITAQKVESGKKSGWVIKKENGQSRYFTQKEIDTCSLRKRIASRTQAELNVRNNVEATIFQLGYHYPNAKSRYRGLAKHKIWANTRCLWINLMRITKFVARRDSSCVQKTKNQPVLPQILLDFINFRYAITHIRIFYFILPKICLQQIF
jgi:hypothetical protein